MLGDQTLGHKLEMIGTLTASATTKLSISPSTAEDSLIYSHQGHSIEESAEVSLSISDLNFDAATYLGVPAAMILSLRLGSIQQAPLECISSAVHEMEVKSFWQRFVTLRNP